MCALDRRPSYWKHARRRPNTRSMTCTFRRMVLLLLVGCGTDEATLSGSCRATDPAATTCTDFRANTKAALESARSVQCQPAFWSTRTCNRTDALGGCFWSTRSSAGDLQAITWYRAPGVLASAQDVEQECARTGATFVERDDSFPPLPPPMASARCADPNRTGNDRGVGKFCRADADCAGQVASLCARLDPETAPAGVCSARCAGMNDDCGEDAACLCINSDNCLCAPNRCFR